MADPIHDPGLYRKLCEPFPSIDAANAALEAFQTELRALRKKHKVADVHVIGDLLNEAKTVKRLKSGK